MPWRILILLPLPLWSVAQPITGKITDGETGEPLGGANVQIAELEYGAVADMNGAYRLDLPPGTYTLKVSFIGYEPWRMEGIELTSGGKTINIELHAMNEYLSAVTVVAGKFDQRLNEVAVSMEVITPRLIENKNTYEVQDLLQQYSGINITDDQANIRGGSGWSYGVGSRVQVLVDDLPLIDGGSGQVQWKAVPTELVDQIEVIKGASSVLYGSSALNGIINVRTKAPSDTLLTEVLLFAGTYGNAPRDELRWWDGLQVLSGLNWRTSWTRKADGFVIGGHALRDKGFEYLVEDHRIRLDGEWTHRAAGTPWEYGIKANVNYRKSGEALVWNSEDEGYIPLDSSSTITKAHFLYLDPFVTRRGNRWVHRLKGRFMTSNNTSRSETNVYDNQFATYYAEYQGQCFLNEHLALTGGLVNIWNESDAGIFQGYHSSHNLAGYIQLDRKFRRLNFSLGGRYEYLRLDNDTYAQPVLRSGLNYALGKATFFRASFGQGYRFPSMAEKYTYTNVGSIWIYPNVDLEPESGWSAEAGLKQGFRMGPWEGFVDGAVFWMRYKDMMEFTFARWAETVDPNQLFGLGFKSVNIGTTEILGFELSTGMKYVSGKSKWQLMGGYTFMDPKIQDPNEVFANAYWIGDFWPDSLTYANTSSDSSGILKYRYQHLLKLDLQFDWGPWMAGASIRANDFMANMDEIFLSDIFAGQVPGIANSRERLSSGDIVWDFRIGYAFSENLRIRFLIRNAFNREVPVRPAKLGPPVEYTLQLQARF